MFLEVGSSEEAVKAYDKFYKGKFNGVKSSVYFMAEDNILKEFTISEIMRHE